jgi:hypothetical protein
MRFNGERTILTAVLATAMVCSAAAAETGTGEAAPAAAGEAAPAATGAAAPAVAQPTPKVAAAPVNRSPAAGWHEGFMVVPSLGINSIMGDAGQNTGVGLRVGLLAGSRIAEHFSANVGLAFDKVTVNTPTASDYVFDFGFNPLLHFPLEKLEIVAGPVVGVFVDKGAVGSGTFATDTWAYGWTLGANAGLLFPVGSKVRVGGLVNLFVRNPIKLCATTNGNDSCTSDGLNSPKVLSLSAAAML